MYACIQVVGTKASKSKNSLHHRGGFSAADCALVCVREEGTRSRWLGRQRAKGPEYYSSHQARPQHTNKRYTMCTKSPEIRRGMQFASSTVLIFQFKRVVATPRRGEVLHPTMSRWFWLWLAGVRRCSCVYRIYVGLFLACMLGECRKASEAGASPSENTSRSTNACIAFPLSAFSILWGGRARCPAPRQGQEPRAHGGQGREASSLASDEADADADEACAAPKISEQMAWVCALVPSLRQDCSSSFCLFVCLFVLLCLCFLLFCCVCFLVFATAVNSDGGHGGMAGCGCPAPRQTKPRGKRMALLLARSAFFPSPALPEAEGRFTLACLWPFAHHTLGLSPHPLMTAHTRAKSLRLWRSCLARVSLLCRALCLPPSPPLASPSLTLLCPCRPTPHHHPHRPHHATKCGATTTQRLGLKCTKKASKQAPPLPPPGRRPEPGHHHAASALLQDAVAQPCLGPLST